MAVAELPAREQRVPGDAPTARVPGPHGAVRVTPVGRIILALLLVAAVKQAFLVAVYPPFAGHDEVGHYGYLWTIEHFGRLPTLDDNLPALLERYSSFTLDWPALYTANHPPGYYLLVYPIMRLAGSDAPADLLARLYALRLAAVPLFLLAIWFAYLLAATLFPGDRFLALTVPAAVAFNPQLSFEGAIVNNDILSICVGTFILYRCAVALRRRLTVRDALSLGVALGCGLLVKATLTVFLPLAALAAAYSWWPRPWSRLRARDYWRGAGAAALALALPTALLPVPWYAFLRRTYGDFSAFRAIQELQAGWNHPAGTFGELLRSRSFHLERLHEYFGYFGWRLIPLTGPLLRAVYLGLAACGAGLIVGLLRVAWRWRVTRRAPTAEAVAGAALVALAHALMYGAMIYFGTMFLLTQARYTFPVAAASATLALLGLRGLIPDRLARPAAALTIAAFAAFYLIVFLSLVVPYAYF